MMFESMMFTLWLMAASAPEGCTVKGTVFNSPEQTVAQLRSDCLVDIQRRDRLIIMTSPEWLVVVEIPPVMGTRPFSYSWGTPWALFGADAATAEWVTVAIGHRTGF